MLWDDSGIRDLGALPGDSASAASDINDAGVIVGSSGMSADTLRSVVWAGDRIIDLNAFPVATNGISRPGIMLPMSDRPTSRERHGTFVRPGN